MPINFIYEILLKNYGDTLSKKIFDASFLIRYLDLKTRSINKGSKSRPSFANIYAIYVLVEDYIKKGYNSSDNDYLLYDGMRFSDAKARTNSLKFGEKLQNHALNNRCNDEFKKYFHSETEEIPIIRNLDTKRYKINELLLKPVIDGVPIDITKVIIDIIDYYVKLKSNSYEKFINKANKLSELIFKSPEKVYDFFKSALNPKSDARLFEIVSYVIIKYYYLRNTITYKINNNPFKTQSLTTYKVGRTNDNDGGIDYIMTPPGRIFQVTEVLDFKKYFLDIHKLAHYPITFVVKVTLSPAEVKSKISQQALKQYSKNDAEKYLNCFEEIITIPILMDMLESNINDDQLDDMVKELINQYEVEYNIEE